MDYYELTPGVFRIQAGVGSDGEIYGGLFLHDTPGIIIGCSGQKKFVEAVEDIIEDKNITGDIRLYLPVLTYEEIQTAYLLQRKFPKINFHVHMKLVDELKFPRENFGKDRYILTDRTKKYLAKNLPKEIENVIGFDKGSSFESEKTKILIIPFDGPHKGHSFIYSRNHKLLCSGVIFGRTSNYRSYYIDKSGSLFQYQNALSFVDGAKSEIIFPIYDEPEFTSDIKFKADNLRDTLKYDKEGIIEICSEKPKTLSEIRSEYLQLYGEDFLSEPYNVIDLIGTRILLHIRQLVEDKVLIKQENQYRLIKN